MSEQPAETLSTKRIRAMLREARVAHTKVSQRSRVRRNLVLRDAPDDMESLMGTFVPDPFDKSELILKTIIGETSKAVQAYASRLSANTPKVIVSPTTTRNDITKTVDRFAGEQERLIAQLWEESGGLAAQWSVGMFQAIDGVGYYLTLPRDADFGLPDRQYYDVEADDEIRTMRREGKITPSRVPHPKTGQLIYAEHGDVWAARRKNSSRYRAESGRSLFTLEALSRDQVYAWRDKDGIKMAAVIEEIHGEECGEGSEYAKSYARKQGIPEDDVGLYGIWTDRQGRIVGGIERGGPPDTSWTRPSSFTLIRVFDRVDQVVFVARSAGMIDGAEEVYRGKHGCKVGGDAACPVVEVPMIRTGMNVVGQEFTTPMEPVFAYAPIVNQIMTLLSNASTFNGIPRWVIELTDGSILRGEDGEPVVIEQGDFVPGLDPAEALGVQGTLKQVTIDVKSLQDLATMYLERLEHSMPAPVMQGESGASAAAWQVRQLIQQGQESLRQGVVNQAVAVKQVVLRWQGWMRDLDVPVYFFPAPGKRADKRTQRNLIEFDPENLTDSIEVVQNLDTPDEATVLMQQGIELHQAGYIDDEEFYEKYAREQDAREAVKRRLKQQLKAYWWTGALPPLPPGAQPGEVPLVKVLGDSLRGRIYYELIARVPQVADQIAIDMATQSRQPMGGDVMGAAGMVMPGMGMNETLQGQLGTDVPGGMATPAPVMA